MKLLVKFDVDADIMDVPEFVVEDADMYRRRFWKWLSDPSVKHKYWRKGKDGNGNTFMGLCFRSDAFAEWLNRKVLKNDQKKAVVLEEHVDMTKFEELPYIFF